MSIIAQIMLGFLIAIAILIVGAFIIDQIYKKK
jgi:hypothetical protein